MPKNEEFINPYRFVERSAVKRELQMPGSHERFSGICGTIEAELLNLTPLVIGGRRDPRDQEILEETEKSFVHNPGNDRPLVPGSSLKGVISTVYELLSGSTDACKAVFGNIQHGRVCKGHIFFSDAVLDLERSPKQAHDVKQLQSVTTVLSSPKRRHRSFYYNAEHIKLYHHQCKVSQPLDMQRQGPISRGQVNRSVESQIVPLLPGCRFTFTVNFDNLTHAQLAVFLRSLFLPAGLCHKIGGAKPLGAGSVHIRPLKMQICDNKTDYYRGVDNVQILSDQQSCLTEINNRCQSISVADDLQKMLLWLDNNDREYRYPDFRWFKDKENVNTGLKTVEDVYRFDAKQQIPKAEEEIARRWEQNCARSFDVTSAVQPRSFPGTQTFKRAVTTRYKPRDEVTVTRVEDPKGKGRFWLQADDGIGGRITQGKELNIAIGETCRCWIASASQTSYNFSTESPK